MQSFARDEGRVRNAGGIMQRTAATESREKAQDEAPRPPYPARVGRTFRELLV